MSASCVICLDSSSRTENLLNDSPRGLFPRLPKGYNQGIFFMYVSFTFFLLPNSDKDAVTGSVFFLYRICHVFALTRSRHESLFAFNAPTVYNIDSHSHTRSIDIYLYICIYVYTHTTTVPQVY